MSRAGTTHRSKPIRGASVASIYLPGSRPRRQQLMQSTWLLLRCKVANAGDRHRRWYFLTAADRRVGFRRRARSSRRELGTVRQSDAVIGSSSPFLDGPASTWLVANRSAFALSDRYPVGPGHSLVVPRRSVSSWWERVDPAAWDPIGRWISKDFRRDDVPALFGLDYNPGNWRPATSHSPTTVSSSSPSIRRKVDRGRTTSIVSSHRRRSIGPPRPAPPRRQEGP